MPRRRTDRSERASGFFSLNIGTLIFIAVLFYIIVTFVIYMTTKHTSSYQVISGPLAQNQTYTALALREETVIQSNAEGYIKYYAQESRKVAKDGVVYSLSSTDTKSKVTGSTTLSADSLSKVRSLTAQFANSYNSANFGQVYSFKYSLAGNILDYAAQDSTGSSSLSQESLFKAPEAGVVVYATDGLEDVTVDNFTSDNFSYSSYSIQNLRSSDKISSGSDVYKLVTDEEWSLLIPLTTQQSTNLEDKKTIKVKFLKDGSSMTGDFEILERDDGLYGRISFASGMLRYVSDRYLEIELVTNSKKGLKIPVSSIVTKDFYLIPKTYVFSTDNSTDMGFNRRVQEKDGTYSSEYVNATIYASDDDYYYVDMNEFSEGDVLIKENSTQTYTIKDTGQLEGVYCINRGYTVFRRISIIDQNEEYCIVASGTSYGLSIYDNIVLDSSTVKEDEILY